MGIVKTAQTNRCFLVNYVKLVSCVLTRKSVKHNIVKEKKCSERDTSQKRTRFQRVVGWCEATERIL